MRKDLSAIIVSALAGFIFLAGVVVSLERLFKYSNDRRKLMRCIADTKHLNALEAQAAALDRLVKPFESLNYEDAIDVSKFFESSFGPDAVDEVREERVPCGGGYEVNRVSVILSGIALKDLSLFVKAAETLRPPLRIVSCTIRASETQAGMGDVSLKLERIERNATSSASRGRGEGLHL